MPPLGDALVNDREQLVALPAHADMAEPAMRARKESPGAGQRMPAERRDDAWRWRPRGRGLLAFARFASTLCLFGLSLSGLELRVLFLRPLTSVF